MSHHVHGMIGTDKTKRGNTNMKKTLGVLVAIMLIGAIACGGAFAIINNSPQYALKIMIDEVTEFGLEGLMPHLTGEARDVIDSLAQVSDNTILNTIMGTLNIDNYVGTLKSKISEIDWSIGNILRNKERANVYLDFNYDNKLVGEIELDMIREDGEWKICDIGFPVFDEINW